MATVARMRKKPLSQQVLVVTGASSGLGRAIARLAGERGAKVVVAARNADGLAGAVREIEAAGSQALAVEVDVARQEDVERLVAAAVERFGRIDTFVANAAVTVYTEAHRLEPEELRRVLDVNFYGQVYAYWAALAHLRASRGTFVSISSALAYRGIPLQAAYCASKAALRNFFESARVELGRERAGVAISLVLPGAINTPQFDRDRQKTGLQPQPVAPIYQPEVVAEATLRCCERPVRELAVSWGAQKLLWGQKLSPRVGDLVLARTGWSGQTTGEPKPLGSPDILFETLPGDPGAHGRFDELSRRSAVLTSARLRLRKGGSIAVLTAPLVAAAIGYHRVTRRG